MTDCVLACSYTFQEVLSVSPWSCCRRMPLRQRRGDACKQADVGKPVGRARPQDGTRKEHKKIEATKGGGLVRRRSQMVIPAESTKAIRPLRTANSQSNVQLFC
jgi:hypothetical protein